MSNVIKYAEFQYRQGEKQLDDCRKTAQGIIKEQKSTMKKEIGAIALQAWLEAGNGRSDEK